MSIKHVKCCKINVFICSEWMQVDLQAPTKVTGIVTQGVHSCANRVKSYKVLYGDRDSNLQAIQNSDGTAMVSLEIK